MVEIMIMAMVAGVLVVPIIILMVSITICPYCGGGSRETKMINIRTCKQCRRFFSI
jgi:hypothetical protein